MLTRPAPPPDAVLRYGGGPHQVADLRLPRDDRAARTAASPGSAPEAAAPLVIFLHGGFWREEYDRSHAGPLAAALAACGYLVCVPEFRRSAPGRPGWPGIFDDVAAAVDALPGLAAARADDFRNGGADRAPRLPGARVGADRARGAGAAHDGGAGRAPGLDDVHDGGGDPARGAERAVLLAGHSAGGHLALWAAARHRLPAGSRWRTAHRPPVHAVVGLAAIGDLLACHEHALGDGAVAELLGGTADALPGRYAQADPAALLPLGAPVLLVHGTEDDRVPVWMSRSFAAHARAAGDAVTLRELPGCEHFGLIDPLSAAWPQVLAVFAASVRA